MPPYLIVYVYVCCLFNVHFYCTQNVRKNLLDTDCESIEAPVDYVGRFLQRLCKKSSVAKDFLHSRSHPSVSSPLLPVSLMTTASDDIERHCISYSTIVLYSRDHTGAGMAYNKIFFKKQPQFSHLMTWQYWLGKTKPK